MTTTTIKVTTLSGESVEAPVIVWVQALVLSLPNDELVKLMSMVANSQKPTIALATGPIPADPAEWTPEHIAKHGLPRRS